MSVRYPHRGAETSVGQQHTGVTFRRVGARFSRMSMVGVGCILVSATVFSLLYVGAWDGVYGTAYGVMVTAKAAMFGALLLLVEACLVN